jgi:cobalt/nickel transport system permease protein
MHIPDGYLSPATSAAAFAAMTPFWMVAGRKARKALRSAAAPRLGLFAAFSFVVMMFNIPLPGGTSGHAVGGALMALVLGPWQAVLGVSAALTIQALFFHDGGNFALGANCLTMAVALPFTAWFVFRLLRRGGLGEAWAAGLAGWFGLMAAALGVSAMLGIQPALGHTAAGVPLYYPYSLPQTLAAMIPAHALVAAPVEGLVTGLVWAYLRRAQPEMLGAEPPVGRLRLWPAWVALLLLALATPIGLLAGGTAWAEWGAGELKDLLGYVPAGLARMDAHRLGSLFPDYTVHGMASRPGYVVSALAGVALVGALAWGVTALARGGARVADEHGDSV